MEYHDHVESLRVASPELAEGVAGLRGLEGVMAWMARRGISLATVEIVFQDEFSHDFLVPLDGQQWLAFGIT